MKLRCRNCNFLKKHLYKCIGLYIALNILSFLLDYKELSFMTWRKIMSKKSMIAVCLCGLAWAGTAQAGFLGNNLELQFLHNLTINSTPPVHIFDGINNDVGNVQGFNVNVGDTQLVFDVPANIPPIGVTISNIIPTISDATGTCNNDCVSFDNNTNSLTIDPLSSGREIVTLTVPEPGAFNLVALGLTIIGMTLYQRKRASAKAI